MDFGLGSYSSSSSSPSSSSSQYKAQKMGPVSTTPWEPQMSPPPNWLGNNKYEATEEDNEATAATATAGAEADSTAADDVEKVHLFDKVVTPSDVGKLNRLVIPKQHAERYFPMDSSTNEKGLLLNFEDRNGKPWRFRYSYWNSSQSYVMTKGWSRFVKDKKLESGDVVSFLRGVGQSGKDRLFIDWKRRPEGPGPAAKHHFSLHRSTPWSPLLVRPSQLLINPLNRNSFSNGVINHPGGAGSTMGGSLLFLRSAASQGGVVEPIVFDSVPVVQGKGAAKRLRLFGVNMECPVSDKSRDDCEMLSTTTTIPNATMAAQNQQFSSSSTSSSSRLYNGTPVLPSIDFLNANKGKTTSSMSLDFDI